MSVYDLRPNIFGKFRWYGVGDVPRMSFRYIRPSGNDPIVGHANYWTALLLLRFLVKCLVKFTLDCVEDISWIYFKSGFKYIRPSLKKFEDFTKCVRVPLVRPLQVISSDSTRFRSVAKKKTLDYSGFLVKLLSIVPSSCKKSLRAQRGARGSL